jgi:hypothetical protein
MIRQTYLLPTVQKAVRAAMETLAPELKKRSCGYAKYVLISESLTKSLQASISKHTR